MKYARFKYAEMDDAAHGGWRFYYIQQKTTLLSLISEWVREKVTKQKTKKKCRMKGYYLEFGYKNLTFVKHSMSA